MISDRESYIDSLRAIAILFVVIFHYTYHYDAEYLLRNDNWSFEFGKYGWSGVDIFFVVSGYCIGMTIIKTKNFSEFIVRRFARLYPAYLVAGFLTLIFYNSFLVNPLFSATKSISNFFSFLIEFEIVPQLVSIPPSHL